jgi:hypothetical protein
MGDAAGRKRINPDLQDGAPIRVQGLQLAESGTRKLNRRQQGQRRSKGPEPCGSVVFVPFCSSNGSDSDLDPFLAKNAKSAKELGRFSRGAICVHLRHLRLKIRNFHAMENPTQES